MDPLQAIVLGHVSASLESSRVNNNAHASGMQRLAESATQDNRLITGSLLQELFGEDSTALTGAGNLVSHIPTSQPFSMPGYVMNPQPVAGTVGGSGGASPASATKAA